MTDAPGTANQDRFSNVRAQVFWRDEFAKRLMPRDFAPGEVPQPH